ncbi:MAG: hypothetical protein AAF682_25750 [Planctomycetota bacterium]
MLRLGPLALALGLTLAPALALTPADDEPAQPAPREALLSAVRADPGAFLGQELSFVLQLESAVERWNPYLSRFGPVEHARYRGWSDDRFLWDVDAFDDPAPYLFVRRKAPAARQLAEALPYERFAVRGTVREIFLGEPWIEVHAVERLPEQVSEGTILHAVRGLELLRERRSGLARAQLERARAGFLPAGARAELDRLIESCDG